MKGIDGYHGNGPYHFANFFDPAPAQKEADYSLLNSQNHEFDLALIWGLEVNHK